MIRLYYMNDTNMPTHILAAFAKGKSLSSSEVAELVPPKRSLVTVKRQMGILTRAGYLKQSGGGRVVKYALTKKGWFLKPFSVNHYLSTEPDSRLLQSRFPFVVFEP